jgi:hypothetical protein
MSPSLQLQKEVLLDLVLQLTHFMLRSFFLYLDSKGRGRGWVCVGTMLRRRRSCRKKRFSAEAGRMR